MKFKCSKGSIKMLNFHWLWCETIEIILKAIFVIITHSTKQSTMRRRYLDFIRTFLEDITYKWVFYEASRKNEVFHCCCEEDMICAWLPITSSLSHLVHLAGGTYQHNFCIKGISFFINGVRNMTHKLESFLVGKGQMLKIKIFYYKP